MFYFPMAGLSSRFAEAGYRQPKYFLDVGGLSLFQRSLQGFSRYFHSDGFCFVYLDTFVDETTIRRWAQEIGLPRSNFTTVAVAKPTPGQAATVVKGIDSLSQGEAQSEEVIIFNIDTIYRNFAKPATNMRHYLDVAKMAGRHWSFVQPDPGEPNRALRVVEKERISNLCSVGLYAFESAGEFRDLYHSFYNHKDPTLEHYVAPIYQSLIDAGTLVEYRLLPASRFEFLGTPGEYEAIKNRQINKLFLN